MADEVLLKIRTDTSESIQAVEQWATASAGAFQKVGTAATAAQQQITRAAELTRGIAGGADALDSFSAKVSGSLRAANQHGREAASTFEALGQVLKGGAFNSGPIEDLGKKAEGAAHLLEQLGKGGIQVIGGQFPGLARPVEGLARVLGGSLAPAMLGIVGGGAILLAFLRNWQNEATKTLADVTNMATGVGAKFQQTVQQIAAIRAGSIGDVRTQVQAEFEATRIGAEHERDVKIRNAQATLDAVLPFSIYRAAAEAKFAADVADAEADANNKILLGKESLNAKLVQDTRTRVQQEREIVAAGREAAQGRVQAVANLTGGTTERVGAVDSGLAARRAAIQDELAKQLQAIELQGHRAEELDRLRATQFQIARDREVEAEANATKERLRILAEAADQAVQLEIRRSERTSALAAARADTARAESETKAKEAELGGDPFGGIEERASGALAKIQSDLERFAEAQDRTVKEAVAAAAKTAATEGEASDAAKNARLNAEDVKRQAIALTADAARKAAIQTRDVEINATRESAQARAGIIQAQLSAAQTVAAGQQALADARTSNVQTVIQAEAEISAARQRSNGDAIEGERTLLRARIESAEVGGRADQERIARQVADLRNARDAWLDLFNIARATGDVGGQAQALGQLSNLTDQIAAAQQRASESATKYRAEIALASQAMSDLNNKSREAADNFDAGRKALAAATVAARGIADAINAAQSAINSARGGLEGIGRRINEIVQSLAGGVGGGESRDHQTEILNLQLREAELQGRQAEAAAIKRHIDDLELEHVQEQLRAGRSDREAAEAAQRAQRRIELENQLNEAQRELIASTFALVSQLRTAGGAGQILRAPKFQTGGVVPGPIGAEQIIIAHGGETVLPVGAGVDRAVATRPAGGGGEGGSLTVQVIIPGTNIVDSDRRMGDLARSVAAKVRDQQRRQG